MSKRVPLTKMGALIKEYPLDEYEVLFPSLEYIGREGKLEIGQEIRSCYDFGASVTISHVVAYDGDISIAKVSSIIYPRARRVVS